MSVLHTILLAAAAVLLAATSAAQAGLRRREEYLPLIGYLIGGALLIGNSAAMLPTAPSWYRIAMITISIAGFAWFLLSVANAPASTSPDDADLIARDIYAGRMPSRPVPARPELRLVHATPVEEPAPVAPTVRVVTQETFDAASPAGSRGATGSTYVAANIDDYVDVRNTRRPHGRHVRRTHTHMDPTERFLRLADAYSIDRGPRSLGRSALA